MENVLEMGMPIREESACDPSKKSPYKVQRTNANYYSFAFHFILANSLCTSLCSYGWPSLSVCVFVCVSGYDFNSDFGPFYFESYNRSYEHDIMPCFKRSTQNPSICHIYLVSPFYHFIIVIKFQNDTQNERPKNYI